MIEESIDYLSNLKDYIGSLDLTRQGMILPELRESADKAYTALKQAIESLEAIDELLNL